ncbi:hypothetical protein DEO72_LG9g1145 [Vigna unguiculata]|uniref:Uncharacterized protein n=1 Tax=Vigna unguiculata TaxID=3917 RepID=A0A4D6MZP7_VIGUN|nr:hypothetical protein DEO72_LG9g1145 [Vigna unguiculata]
MAPRRLAVQPAPPGASSASPEGNLSRPIRTGHNQHTHTGNTRQPEPQLKGSSCSSAIPSHNSRDSILSHNSRNITCLTPIPSHNSRDTALIFLSPSQPLGGTTSAARRTPPRDPTAVSLPPGGSHPTARHHDNLAQNPRKLKSGEMAPRRLAVQPAPPGASSASPEISINHKRRLAAGSVLPGGSLPKTPKQCRTNESPGGGSSPAKRNATLPQVSQLSDFRALSAPPGASSASPEISINHKRRLAAGRVLPGGSLPKTPKQCRTNEAPGGGSSPAKRCLEISQKRSSPLDHPPSLLPHYSATQPSLKSHNSQSFVLSLGYFARTTISTVALILAIEIVGKRCHGQTFTSTERATHQYWSTSPLPLQIPLLQES